MHVEINQRQQNWGLKPVNLVGNFYVSNINIHTCENNSATAKFGPKNRRIWGETFTSQISTYICVKIILQRQNSGLKLVNLVGNFFSPWAAVLSYVLEN